MAAWIRRLVASGAEVHLLWMHATPVREDESRRAAQVLGVPDERLTFLDGTDRWVCREIPRLLPLLTERIAALAPDRVVTTAFEQGHLDHDATNYMVNRAFAGDVLEFPAYHAFDRLLQVANRFADPAAEAVMELTPEERALKWRLARSFRSQGLHRNMLLYDAAARLLRAERLGTYERCRVQTHRDFETPNLPQNRAARVRRTWQWRVWRESLEALAGTPIHAPVADRAKNRA